MTKQLSLFDKSNKNKKTMATKTKTGLKADGTLKKGFKYAKGGKIVKVLKQRGKSNLKLDAKKKALKPGKRVSKAGAKNQYGTSEGGNTYYEYRANRTDLKPKKRGRSL